MSLKKVAKYNRKEKEIDDGYTDTKPNKKRKKKVVKNETDNRRKEFLSKLDVHYVKVGNKYVVVKDINGEFKTDYTNDCTNGIKFHNIELAKKFCTDNNIKDYTIVTRKKRPL